MIKPPKQLKKLLPALAFVVVVLVVPNLAQAFEFEAAAQKILWSVINVFFGWLVWAGGSLLDWSINETVIGFGSFYNSSGLGFSINSLWTIVRDIFNMTFIFGLVFIGFKMIFDSSDSSARRMLGSLIIAALLVNFSLFITKFVIDFANIAGMQFASGFTAGGTQLASVSAGFMSIFGLTGVFSTGSELAGFSGGAGWGYIFGALMLYVVAGFVFLSGAMLLIIRFVVLNIYMVLSPLMFLGFVFPGFQSVSTSYWRGFLSQAFFAPAYIIMIYFSYQILVNLKGAAGAGNFGQLFGTNGGVPPTATFAAVFPMFIMTAVFMIASLVVAQKMSDQGASSSLALGKRISGGVRKRVVGAATYLPRVVARKGANVAGEWAETRLNKIQSGKGVAAWVAKRNFVDRNARGATTAAAGAQFGTGTTNKLNTDYSRKTQARANQTEAADLRAASFKSNTEALDNMTLNAAGLSTALEDLGKTMRAMSKEEKNDLSLSKLTDKNVAVHLTDDDMKNFEASGSFSAAEIQKIKDAKKDGYKSIAVGGSTLANVSGGVVTGYGKGNVAKAAAGDAPIVDTRASLAAKGVKEAGNLPVDVYKVDVMYQHITPAMVEERMKNGITEPERIAMRDAKNRYVAGAPAGVQAMWTSWASNTNNNWAQKFNV